MNLEILNLSNNEIGDEGVIMMGGNNTWEKLKSLDLSSNNINDKKTIIFVCSNGTWKELKSLFLAGNPAVLEATVINEAIKVIASGSLEILTLPNANIEETLLQYLKYSTSESVIELSLVKKGYNAIHVGVIGGNRAWNNLQMR